MSSTSVSRFFCSICVFNLANVLMNCSINAVHIPETHGNKYANLPLLLLTCS